MVLVKIHDILTATILPPCHKMIYDVKVNAGGDSNNVTVNIAFQKKAMEGEFLPQGKTLEVTGKILWNIGINGF